MVVGNTLSRLNMNRSSPLVAVLTNTPRLNAFLSCPPSGLCDGPPRLFHRGRETQTTDSQAWWDELLLTSDVLQLPRSLSHRSSNAHHLSTLTRHGVQPTFHHRVRSSRLHDKLPTQRPVSVSWPGTEPDSIAARAIVLWSMQKPFPALIQRVQRYPEFQTASIDVERYGSLLPAHEVLTNTHSSTRASCRAMSCNWQNYMGIRTRSMSCNSGRRHPSTVQHHAPPELCPCAAPRRRPFNATSASPTPNGAPDN